VAHIQKLDSSVVNQIAAGEVVIQPCSVLKEVTENSLDAGASVIEVDFNGSGADAMIIKDNGMGMDPEDLKLCIEPHATSKIHNADDLYRVGSYGFRGEALASIAEVSNFEVLSKTKESNQAHRLFRQKDKFDLEPASRAQGTTISIKNLFHNVPVRRRFLKSERAESSANLDTLKKVALSRPWVGMKVTHNEKTCFELPQDQSLENRVRDLAIFDKQANFLSFKETINNINFEGLVVAPPLHYGNGQKIHLFINRRPIKDKALVQALVRAFSSYIPERRFPGGIVFIDMEAEDVDVNIHPTKSEVRFREPEVIFKSLYAAIKNQLLDSAQELDAREPQQIVYKSSGIPKTVPMNRHYGGVYEGRPKPFGNQSANPFSSPRPAAPVSSLAQDDPFEPKVPGASNTEYSDSSFAIESLPKAYQILNRFVLIEYDDYFELMDQHAIHERIVFNQLAHEDRSKTYSTQNLLSPITLPLPEQLIDISSALQETFRDMGYALHFSDKEQKVTIEGIPDFYSVEKALKVLEEILDDLSEGVLPDRDQLRRNILHSAACRSALKAGDPMSEEELKAFVAAAITMDEHQGSCPHGRNARWRINIDEANSMFDRI
jgi:DNA mismatch repair protein MutL